MALAILLDENEYPDFKSQKLFEQSTNVVSEKGKDLFEKV
jgi:hypothetical protein